MANPGPQDEQAVRGALQREVFFKNVSKYTEQRERRQCNANTQLGFRIGIKAECPDPRQPSWLAALAPLLSSGQTGTSRQVLTWSQVLVQGFPVQSPPAMQETLVRSLGQKIPWRW